MKKNLKNIFLRLLSMKTVPLNVTVTLMEYTYSWLYFAKHAIRSSTIAINAKMLVQMRLAIAATELNGYLILNLKNVAFYKKTTMRKCLLVYIKKFFIINYLILFLDHVLYLDYNKFRIFKENPINEWCLNNKRGGDTKQYWQLFPVTPKSFSISEIVLEYKSKLNNGLSNLVWKYLLLLDT